MHCPCGNAKVLALGLCATCYTLKRQDEEDFGSFEKRFWSGRVPVPHLRRFGTKTVPRRTSSGAGKVCLKLMITLCPGGTLVHRTLAVHSEMPPLLLQLWREQHSDGHEQKILNFEFSLRAGGNHGRYQGEGVEE